jgi:pyruvate dehydrogenase E2 component (dihydrolipoamide acetyltransferase)
VLVKEGDKIKVGQTIAVIEEGENGKEKEEKVSEEKDRTGSKKKVWKKKRKSLKKRRRLRKRRKKRKLLQRQNRKASAEITDIKLPELGENIESADVVSVLVKEGDKIEKDQGILKLKPIKLQWKYLQTYPEKFLKCSLKKDLKLRLEILL